MWTYNGTILDESLLDNYVGFVYIITNLTNNKKYIGKKLFKFTKTKKAKGKKKKYKVDSDWRDYYGSNKELLEDVVKLGPDKFDRRIIRLCTTKGECSYYEAKEQFVADALLSIDYYNTWISCKIRGEHMKRKK